MPTPNVGGECWHSGIYLQTHYDEFQHYRLAWIAPALGVRETVRVLGEYVLTEHDLRAGLSRQTARGHHRAGRSRDGPSRRGRRVRRVARTLRRALSLPDSEGFRNLLIACRAASFSSLAASSCRLSRTMMQLGQAAGTAAALAKQLNVDLPDVPAEILRDSLRAQHVQLEHPMPDNLRAHLDVV